MRRFFFTALILAIAPALAVAQVSYSTTGSTYTQDFDTLITSGTNQAWSNNTTITGWHLFRQPAAGTAITTYNAGDGSVNTGSFYSFGTGTNTDRSLGGTASGGTYFGSPASGAVAGWIAVGFTNNTGENLSAFTVGYNGEQWRNGGNVTAQTMVLEYGVGATFTDVATWTPAGAAFNFTSVVNTATAAAVDGNVAGLVTGLGGTVNFAWNTGDTLWIRYIENNDAGNDHGLGIDNFSFSATASAVPEPTTYALIGLSLASAGLVEYRRRRKLANA
jgi:hypothetical protein